MTRFGVLLTVLLTAWLSVEPAFGEPTIETGDLGLVDRVRVVPLEGGRNFRDLGGYETADGRVVKWGQVYRSGALAHLTPADQALVDGLGIETIIDFRSTSERHAEPTNWQAANAETISWDYELADTGTWDFLSRDDEESQDGSSARELTPELMTAMMIEGYRHMATGAIDRYAAMFDRLVAQEAPLLFHCTAGKDRTGVGAALVLSALGVPRSTVVEDYAMSETIVDFAAEISLSDGPLAGLGKELAQPLMRSDPDYIKATLAQLEADYGSVLAFVQDELGVDDAELLLLRERLLD